MPKNHWKAARHTRRVCHKRSKARQRRAAWLRDQHRTPVRQPSRFMPPVLHGLGLAWLLGRR